MIITIDGPAASGKSSVAKDLAKKLGFYYLNTGLLYRAVAYILMQQKGSLDTILPQDLEFINQLTYRYHDNVPTVLYEGNDITPMLFSASLEQGASIVSSNKAVRDALLAFQRRIAQEHDVIADGRDCGSVVFPNAEYKFFLTADVDARTQRLMNDAMRKQTQSF